MATRGCTGYHVYQNEECGTVFFWCGTIKTLCHLNENAFNADRPDRNIVIAAIPGSIDLQLVSPVEDMD